MPKAARERIANPRAGTALAPPFGLASREAPLDERDGRLVTEIGTDVKGNVAIGDDNLGGRRWDKRGFP